MAENGFDRQDVKIQIVEDNSFALHHIQTVLRSLGFSVHSVCSNGLDALEILRGDPPTLVLMDINLSGELDGVETARAMLEERQLPIVYLTAAEDDETMDRAKETQPFGYLIKPVDAQALRPTIEMAVYKAHADQQLRTSQKQLQTILDNTSEAVLAVDIAHTVTYCNPSFHKLLGLQDPDVVGKPLMELLRLRLEQMPNSGEVDSLEELEDYLQKDPDQVFLLPDSAGRQHFLEVSINPLNLQGNPSAPVALITLREITHRIQQEQIVRNLARGISSLTGRDFFSGLVRFLGRSFQARQVLVGRVHNTEGKPKLHTLAASQYDQLVDNFVYDLSYTPCLDVLRWGHLEIESELKRHYSEDPYLENSPLETYYGVRLQRSDGRPFGLISVATEQPVPDTVLLVQTLEILASRTSAEVERYEANEALLRERELLEERVRDRTADLQQTNEALYEEIQERRKAEQEAQLANQWLQSVISNTPGVVWRAEFSDSGVPIITYISNSIHDLLGQPAASFIGTSLLEWNVGVENFDHMAFVAAARKTAGTGKVSAFEYEVRRANGEMLWLETRMQADYFDQVLTIDGTVFDITQRKQTEHNLLRSQEFLMGLSQAASELLSHNELETRLETALAILGEASGADRAYFYRFWKTEDHKPHCSLTNEWSQPNIPALKGHPRVDSLQVDGLPSLEQLYYEQKPIFRREGQFKGADMARIEELGIRAVALIPIVLNDEPWGFAGLTMHQHNHYWPESQLQLLTAFANNVGNALQRELAETELRSAQLELREVNAQLENRVRERTLELSDSKERLDAILNSITDGFVSLNGEGVVTYLNRRAEEQLRIPGAEFVGQHYKAGLWDLLPTKLQTVLDEALQHSSASQFEVEFEALGTWHEFNLYPFQDGVGLYFRDITPRKLGEIQLKEALELQDTVFQQSTDALLILSSETLRVINSNKLARRVFGAPRQIKLVDKPLFELMPGLQPLLQLDQAQTGLIWEGELNFQTFQQEQKVGDIALVGLKSSDRGFIVLRVRDITEHYKTQQRLRLLEAAFQNARESIFITEALIEAPGPRILYANPAFCQLTGYTMEELAGQTPRILQGPKTDPDTLKRVRTELEAGRSVDTETYNYRKDGAPYLVSWHISPIRDEADNIVSWISIQRDVTEERQAQQELVQARINQERAVTEAIVRAQETERKRFAEDLHDGLGHYLSVLKMQFTRMQDHTDQHAPPDYRETFHTTRTMLDEVTQEVRNISRQLMPSVLYDFGLDAAIRRLCRTIQNADSGIAVEYDGVNTEGVRLPEVMEINLFRIVQEMLNNAVKYAEPTEIHVSLQKGARRLLLEVMDNGKGFDVEAIVQQGRGLGLQNIETRVNVLGGSYELETAPGGGTAYYVDIPMNSLDTYTV